MNQDAEKLAQGVAAGDRRSLARALTLVESAREDDRAAARNLLARLKASPGGVARIGITGPPGVGKSTLIEQLGLRFVDAGKRVCVLAVDPTSSRTGGSILGDKTRMAELSRKAGVFIRPSPTGGGPSALSARTRQALAVLAGGPFDYLFLETAGAGQADTDVAALVDALVLVLTPGGGDELQGMKRGVRELADLIVVNKADGDLLKLAKSTAADYARSVPSARRAGTVVCCSALEGTGLDELAQAIAGLAEARAREAPAATAPAPGEAGRVGRLNHVALATADLEKADRVLPRRAGRGSVGAQAAAGAWRDHRVRAPCQHRAGAAQAAGQGFARAEGFLSAGPAAACTTSAAKWTTFSPQGNACASTACGFSATASRKSARTACRYYSCTPGIASGC